MCNGLNDFFGRISHVPKIWCQKDDLIVLIVPCGETIQFVHQMNMWFVVLFELLHLQKEFFSAFGVALNAFAKEKSVQCI